MIYWAQLLHFYQPPTQSPSVLHKICDESYRPLLNVLLQHPHARVTVNINGVLTEMLHDCGHDDIIDKFRQLAERGQIEFTGSGKYHPILPLIPQEEMNRQIQLNLETNRQFFGEAYKPYGFFPPEMCYGKEIVSPVLDAGHEWVILSGISCPSTWPLDVIHYLKKADKRLVVFFRDDIISNRISFQNLEPSGFFDNLAQLKGNKEVIYVVTAMDAETFGHHIKHWEELFLAEVYKQIQPLGESFASSKRTPVLHHRSSSFRESTDIAQAIRAVTVSQLVGLFPIGKVVNPRLSSWSTSKKDLVDGNPYPLWKHKNNKIHSLQWEHLDICLALVDEAVKVSGDDEAIRFASTARSFLDRALYSCQFWWASKRPMWDINLVHKGLLEQWQAIVNAYQAISLSQAGKDTKRDCYHKLIVARNLRDKIIDSFSLETGH